MVFFTCNHCGESVKKSAVEKHYNTKCRGAPIFVGCMDCLKDFRNEEYIEHVTCVSELQRYSGKDFVPKVSENKGQKKQDSWTEIIRSILTSTDYNLKPYLRIIFERLQAYDNVPRKKVKFENFVKNSFKINQNLLPEIWGILEKENAKLKGPGVQGDASKSNDSKNVNGDIHVNESDANNDTKKKKKKDKKKENKSINESNGETNKDDVMKESADKVEDKKKSKKRKTQQNDDANFANEDEHKTSESPNNGIDLEPKKKKQKKTKEKEINLENGNANDSIVEPTNSNFDWYLTISETTKDGMNFDKLKKKVLKKYKGFLNCDEFENENKIEKTFKKYFKKSGINVENDICTKIVC